MKPLFTLGQVVATPGALAGWEATGCGKTLPPELLLSLELLWTRCLRPPSSSAASARMETSRRQSRGSRLLVPEFVP